VGPAKVRDIIAYREKRAFRSVAELARIRGIGPKMVRRLRPHLSVTGATTFQRVIRAPAAPDMVSGAAVLAPPPAPARAPGAAEPARSPSAQAGHGPTTSAPRDAGAPDR
jgi:type II secretory pathway component PulK